MNPDGNCNLITRLKLLEHTALLITRNFSGAVETCFEGLAVAGDPTAASPWSVDVLALWGSAPAGSRSSSPSLKAIALSAAKTELAPDSMATSASVGICRGGFKPQRMRRERCVHYAPCEQKCSAARKSKAMLLSGLSHRRPF
jgi:hypothetical protein